MKTIKENLLRNVGVGKTKLIEDWLRDNTTISGEAKHGVGEYVINNDFTIDVKGSIYITNKDIKEFPEYIQFNKVTNTFSCMDCDKLISLRGCPKEVYEFNCIRCLSLKSLEYGPGIVKFSYYCSWCRSLTNLKGAPSEIGYHFSCNNCVNLTSLEGGPKKVKGSFYCEGCSKLDNMKGLPTVIEGDLLCVDCKRKFTKEEIRKECRVQSLIRNE